MRPAPAPASTSSLQYPKGVLKKTWCFGYDRDGSDVKIEEILRKRDLNIAVLSSWQIDMEWLMSKLDTEKTKILLVYGESNPDKYQEHRDHAAASNWGKNVRIAFPPMARGPYTCMHSKLMLLFYEDSMRVAIPSANLLGFDWGETGVMENSVFIIDLPRLPEEHQGANNTTLVTPFARELLKFVTASKLDDAVQATKPVTEGLHKFDWRATSHLAFIHTIGLTFHSAATRSTGLNQLSRSIRELSLSTSPNEPMQVDYSASSIGALTTEKVEAMFRALRGIDQSVPTATKPKTPSTAAESAPLESRFRIHYPSHSYVVDTSKGGPENAGTQFMTPGWQRPSFPISLLRDFESTRPGCLSHNKFIVVRTARAAFVYSGSANFSASAWGNLTWDRAAKAPKLTCGNWECGVLVKVWPPEEEVPSAPDDVSTASEGEEDGGIAIGAEKGRGRKLGQDSSITLDADGVLPLSVFDGKVNIPYRIPGRSYVEHGLEPWIQLHRR